MMKIGIMSFCIFVVVELLLVFGILRLYDMQWSWILMPLVILVGAAPAVAMGAAASERKRDSDKLNREDLK